MRFHKRYPLLQLWGTLPDAHAVMNAGTLAIARYEPAIAAGVQPAAFLDLIFADGTKIAVMPNIEVATGMLIERERTPLVWPETARSLGYDVLHSLEERVLPWLESRTLARQSNSELVQRFSGAIDEELFERARSSGFLGAAAYTDCMAALAPYVYALRFCAGERVCISDPQGATGATLLGTRGTVCADLGSASLNDLASQWFSRSIFGELNEACAVSVSTSDRAVAASNVEIMLDRYTEDACMVHVATPVPSDVMISFDPEDAPPVRSFGVRVLERVPMRNVASLQDTLISGGSSGAILMLMREDFERAPDADTDEARALAARLEAEGFAVKLAPASTLTEGVHADLVHAFGIRALGEGRAVLERLHCSGVPLVATPSISRFPHEERWGPQVLQAVFARSADDAMLAERLELVERRRLNTDSAAAQTGPLGNVIDVALVSCEAEALHLRERCGFTRETVCGLPYLRAIDGEIGNVAAVTGSAPFVLVHAPLEWRSSIVLLVQAAVKLGLPVIAAGPTIDVDVLRAARSLAPDLFIHIPRPTAPELTALYRSARVFSDMSWAPSGLHRVATALASGCAVVASQSSYAAQTWPEGVFEADPGSQRSVATALDRAWRAARPAPVDAYNASSAFSAVISAYALAQRARQPA